MKNSRTLMLRRLSIFVAIGALGFCIEAGIITFARDRLGIAPVWARLVSFPCAVLVTWWLNRKYNFRSKNDAASEGWRYFLSQFAGALANLGLFALSMALYPPLAQWPLVALAIGAVAGLAVNFALSSLYVFRKRSGQHG